MTSSTLLGASRPRIEGEPTDRDGNPIIVGTRGELAIELMRRAGMVLEEWQQDSLRLMMSVRADGNWACRHYCEWCPRQNGKGALIEARALAGFLLLGEKEIVWSAHEFQTANKEFTRLWALFCKLGTEVRPGDPRLLDIAIRPGESIRVKVSSSNANKGFKRLDTNATIEFIARSKGGGRGFSGDLIVLDEAFALTVEHQDALQPTMRARPKAQVVYMSTPPLDGDSGEIMFGMRSRAEDEDFVRLGYRDWGIDGDLDHLEEIDLDDRTLWAASNPALGGPRMTEETVEDDRRTMRSRGGRGFAKECLGVWPLPRSVAGGSISVKDWEKVLDGESVRDKAAGCALGVHLSVERDYAAIFLYGLREDRAGHGQMVDYRAGTEWVAARLKLLKELLDPVGIGMLKAVYTYLKDDLDAEGLRPPEDATKPERGDILVMSAGDSAAACGKLLVSTRQHTIHVKPDSDPERAEILNDAVKGAKTRRMGDTVAWSFKDEDDEPSPVQAMTNAKFTYGRRINVVTKAYGPAKPTPQPESTDDRSLFRPTERLNI